MIKTIRLNKCTPYQEGLISDCKKVNFIFGANGSGKSTISSFLAGTDDSRFSSSSIEWSDETHEHIEVYNREFRKANLQQEMRGIFTLGSATIEEINEIESLKADLELKRKAYDSYYAAYKKKVEEEKPAREAKYREDVWKHILKKNENDFKEAFKGFRNNKESFLREVKKRVEGIPDHEGTVTDRQKLLDRAQTLYVAKPERCDSFEFDSIEKIAQQLEDIRKENIWNTIVIGSNDVDIATLINKLGNASWVNQGRQYIESNSEICPFCQQKTITDNFRESLKKYFDSDYKRNIEYMQELLEKYCNASSRIIEEIDLETKTKEASVMISNLNLDAILAKKDLIQAELNTNIATIEEKIKTPESRYSLTDIKRTVFELTDALKSANKIIDTHNKLVDESELEKTRLCDDIWASCIHDVDWLVKSYNEDIGKIDKAISGITKSLDAKRIEIDQLSEIIQEKGKNVTSVQPAIDEINRMLRSYGFTNFSIQKADERENYYCIKRDDGSSATNSLSEGEETFLTFLYFMQRTKGSTEQSHVTDKRIIVLDDPISSLDSTVLYIVGAMVKELSKNVIAGDCDVDQLFVLTHNVFFHKEASFKNSRSEKRKDVNYWVVRKNNGISTIHEYGMDNPISTSYELLWKELKDNTRASIIAIQNIMRRIIENYFGILGKKRDDYIVNQFDSIEDRLIARSLLYWINDGSHSVPDDLYIDSYTDALPRYKEVFREIFVKTNNLSHYNMMMGIEEVDSSLDALGEN